VLIYCISGTGYYVLNNGEPKKVDPGQLLIIPPDTPHEYGASDENPWSIFWIHLKGLYLDAFMKKFSPPELSPVADSAGEQIKELFYRCFHLLEMPYQEEEFIYLCQLAAVVVSLVPCAAKQSTRRLTPNGSRGIERTIAFMRIHLHENVTLEQLSKAAGFSPSHLHYLFRQYSGYAPIEYFLRMKIQAAAGDVFFSDLTIREIADIYSIEDPYYFSRLFKKIMGMSPLQYRKSSLRPNGKV
jgi:AraC-like DNA-binding protein